MRRWLDRRVGACVVRWMHVYLDGRVCGRMNGRLHGWVGAWVVGCMTVRVDGCMQGWMHGCVGGSVHEYLVAHTNVRLFRFCCWSDCGGFAVVLVAVVLSLCLVANCITLPAPSLCLCNCRLPTPSLCLQQFVWPSACKDSLNGWGTRLHQGPLDERIKR